VFDSTHGSGELGHYAHVLVMIYGINAKLIENILFRLGALAQSFPFGLFHAAQIMRCVYVSHQPSAVHLHFEIIARVLAFDVSKSFLILFLSADSDSSLDNVAHSLVVLRGWRPIDTVTDQGG